jgi:hypothetical protein
MKPTRADEYRARAQDCTAVARLMSDGKAKSTFEKLAQKWLNLAEGGNDPRKNRRRRPKSEEGPTFTG